METILKTSESNYDKIRIKNISKSKNLYEEEFQLLEVQKKRIETWKM